MSKNINTLKNLKSKRSSQLLVFATIILGLIIGMQIRDSYLFNQAGTNVKSQFDSLTKNLEKEKLLSEKLKSEITALEKNNEMRYKALEIILGDDKVTKLNAELERAKKLAGLTDVEGKGIIINLADAQEIPESMLLQDATYFIVHQTDLHNIVNVLKAAGAEAISINDERLISTSTQMCAGPTIIINGKRYASPYQIKAIGNPKVLKQKLENSSIYNTLIAYFNSDSLSITESDRVFIPKYIINTKEISTNE